MLCGFFVTILTKMYRLAQFFVRAWERVAFGLFATRMSDQSTETGSLQPATGDRLRRVGDLSLAYALGLLTLPLLGFVALAIWLESRGPVFRYRVRLLPDGRRIFLVSFRTAASDEGALRWESGFETRIGSFLRRSRIEHLPQLVNVMRGEMTLVGRHGLPPFVLD